MKTVKEKPKEVKTLKGKGKSARRSMSAISTKQAAKLMKDKYVQQLDQRQSETGSVESQIAEQIEGAGTWAVDELLLHEPPRSPRQRNEKIKEEPHTAPEGTEETAHTVLPTRPIERPTPKEAVVKMGHNSPSSKDTTASNQVLTSGHSQFTTPFHSGGRPISQLSQSISLEQSCTTDSSATILPKQAVPIKERPTLKIKERGRQVATPSTKPHSAFPSKSIASIHSSEGQATHSIIHPDIRSTTPTYGDRGHSNQQKVIETKARPQCASSIKQHTDRLLSAETSANCSTPPIQKFIPPTSNKLHPRRILFGRKKIVSQQASRTPVALSDSAGGNLSKLLTNSRGGSPKTRGPFYQKGSYLPKSFQRQNNSNVLRSTHVVQKITQWRMTQRAIQQAKNTTKAPVAVFKKSAAVVMKVAATLINTAATLVGGGILLLAMVVVMIVAAVANSPFGLFFAQEPNAPGTVSVSQAVNSVNMAYNRRLELLQSGNYDNIIVQGQAPAWAEVLAVFAVKTAGTDVDGLDVATLDPSRVSKLTAVFWDMTAIEVTEEEIEHPAVDSVYTSGRDCDRMETT